MLLGVPSALGPEVGSKLSSFTLKVNPQASPSAGTLAGRTIGLAGVKMISLGALPPSGRLVDHARPPHEVPRLTIVASPSYDMTSPWSVQGMPSAAMSLQSSS